jgi:hypothetical protein
MIINITNNPIISRVFFISFRFQVWRSQIKIKDLIIQTKISQIAYSSSYAMLLQKYQKIQFSNDIIF